MESDLKTYMEWVQTKISPHVTDQNMMGWASLGLGAETGEVQGLMEKGLRRNEPVSVDELELELGDVLFYWMATCIASGIDPDDVMHSNIAKLNKREQEGKLLNHADA
jgi:NTP pyrophosphatase (non-canonical NTP hydrolase)